jgi:flavin-dependent thymidylate synthase
MITMIVSLINKEMYNEIPPYIYIGSAAAITRGVTFEEFLEWPEKRQKGIVRECYSSGHWSVFEFATFDIEVTGASRVFETQAVRSRLCSYEWESGRRNQHYEPADITKGNNTFYQVQNGIRTYGNMTNIGYHPENARYALPQGVARKARICRNFRNLMETALIRMCTHAQREYREFMALTKEAVTQVDPFLAEFLVPKCTWYGYCNEARSCHLDGAPTKTEVLARYRYNRTQDESD